VDEWMMDSKKQLTDRTDRTNPTNKTNNSIGVAVLCGGQASRFGGANKGLIELSEGTTILQRLIREIRIIGLQDILLCTNEAEPYTALGLDAVPDTHKGKGPLGGIEAALAHYTGRKAAVLILPCDLPAITANEIMVLLEAYSRSRQSIVYAQTADGIEHPLCAVVAVSEREAIRAAITGDRLGVRRLWQELGGESIAFDDTERFVNVNSPEEFDRYIKGNGRMKQPRTPGETPGQHYKKMRKAMAWRIPVPESAVVEEQCCAAVEEALTLSIEGVGDITMMCTPADIEALALGFLYSEGYITSKKEAELMLSPTESLGSPVIMVKLDNPDEFERGRNLIVTSSCGVCGVRSIQSLATSVEVERTLKVPAEQLVKLAAAIRSRQEIFQSTGGTHAAAIFGGDGTIYSFAEDIGRHSALDKAVGKLLLCGGVPGSCGVVLSGRVSFEMVAKAARAGIELIAAVSASTTMAIEAAEQCGITLCSFVRQNRVTVFTNPERVTEVQDERSSY